MSKIISHYKFILRWFGVKYLLSDIYIDIINFWFSLNFKLIHTDENELFKYYYFQHKLFHWIKRTVTQSILPGHPM
jgi:DUF438 domain-containing protein